MARTPDALTGIFPDETVLADDSPVYGDYLYVADGRVVRSDLHGATVRHLKRLLGASEIRRCNIEARRNALARDGGTK